MISERQRDIKKLQKEFNLLKTISSLIFRLASDLPLLSKISIIKLVYSNDKSTAKIFIYSSFGKETVESFIESLIPYIPSIRGSISALINLRMTPKLRFIYDSQYEKIVYMEKLIDSVQKE